MRRWPGKGASMRLIDAMAYRKVLDEEMDYLLENTKHSIKYRLGIEVAIADLGDMPTIDAVPVVRCKDCKNYRLFKNRFGVEISRCMLIGADVGNEAFCSYGERKDGEG